MKKLSDRIRDPERKKAAEELSVVIMEVFDDGSIEMDSATSGEKIRMTEEEYQAWAERYQKPEELHILVEYV